MDVNIAALLKQVDPVELGDRLRTIRQAKGLTQSDVAGGELSVAYISRIETGQRRPTVRALEKLSEKLQVPAAQLLGLMAPQEAVEIHLLLDFAELSLETGDAEEAESGVRVAIERLGPSQTTILMPRALLLHARVLEARGDLDGAIAILDALIGDNMVGLAKIRAGITLSRLYRLAGDLGRSISVGDRVCAEMAAAGLGRSDEAAQLAATLSSAHFENGDVDQAILLCERAIDKAEEVATPTQRASAYWAASKTLSERGLSGDAIVVAQRALALVREEQDARNLARLRSELGRMQLQLDPPKVEDAQHNLERAVDELAGCNAREGDRSRARLGLAHAKFFSGDLDAARDLVGSVLASMDDRSVLLHTESKALEGQLHLAAGDPSAATDSFREAARLLTSARPGRRTAQLWFDLADLFDEVGLGAEARDAYRRAASSTGLRGRSGSRS